MPAASSRDNRGPFRLLSIKIDNIVFASRARKGLIMITDCRAVCTRRVGSTMKCRPEILCTI
jgi:hypothetical protein